MSVSISSPAPRFHLGAAGVIAIVLTACGPGGGGPGGPPPAVVSIAEVVVKPVVEWDDFTGRIQAVDTVLLQPRITGYLDGVHFTEGEIVAKGDLLFTIDDRETRAAGALAAFDEAWLTAIEETENAVANYRAITERVSLLNEAVMESTEAARFAKLRYDAGADDYLSVLDADRTRIELDDQLALAQTDRATALAALYKALAGDFARVRRED